MGRIAAGAGIAAALLALSPIFRSIPVAHRLPVQLTNAFGEAPAGANTEALKMSTPLSVRDLIFGVPLRLVSQKTLVYVIRDNQALTLDLFQGLGEHPPTPCVVVIHGGSWQSGDSAQLAPLNSYLAARGYTVAAINYRFAPEHPFPAALEDVKAAIAYL